MANSKNVTVGSSAIFVVKNVQTPDLAILVQLTTDKLIVSLFPRVECVPVHD